MTQVGKSRHPSVESRAYNTYIAVIVETDRESKRYLSTLCPCYLDLGIATLIQPPSVPPYALRKERSKVLIGKNHTQSVRAELDPEALLHRWCIGACCSLHIVLPELKTERRW